MLQHSPEDLKHVAFHQLYVCPATLGWLWWRGSQQLGDGKATNTGGH